MKMPIDNIHRLLRSSEYTRMSLYKHYRHLIDDTLTLRIGTTSDKMYAKYEDRVRRHMKSISDCEEYLSEISRDIDDQLAEYNARHDKTIRHLTDELEKNRNITA